MTDFLLDIIACRQVTDIYHGLHLVAPFVDKVKIGKLNYYPSDIDWGKFGRKAESLCKQLGIDYYIKDSLRKEMIGNNAEEKE